MDINDIIFKEEWGIGWENPSYMQPHICDIYISGEEGDLERIGTTQAFVFHGSTPQGVVPFPMLYDAADAENEDLCEFVEAFFGERGPLNMGSDNYEGECEHSVLYLASLKLDPQYRGLGLGLQIIRALCARYGMNIHIALHPCPNEEWEGVTKDEGARKLRKHWGQLGFNRETGPYLWDNTALKSDFNHN